MSRVTRSGGLLAACMLTLAAEAAAADFGCAPALPLVWVDGNATAPEVLDEAEREASRIWQAAGIHLDWARSGPARAIGQDEILVVLRSALAVRTIAEARARTRQPLGRLIRASADRPGRLIEVALPDIVGSVVRQSLHGHRIRDLPQVARDRVIGRALGRVVAHEIGHWLFGREHADHGLMRAAIQRPALVAADPPALPPAWPSSARARLRTHRPCPPPPAQPGAPS